MKYEYEILKVGDADVIIIRHFVDNEPYVILIDAGNAGDGLLIKRHLLKYYGSTYINLAICTHPDSDHKDGFFDLLLDDEVTIGEFWLTDPACFIDEQDIKRYRSHENAVTAVRKIWNKSTDSKLNLIDLALDKCIGNVFTVIDGFKHKNLPITVLGPTADYYGEIVKNMVAQYGILTYKESSKGDYDEAFRIDDDEIKSVIDTVEDNSPFNASSLIILYQPGDEKLLFAGDANTTSLQMMLEKYKWLRDVNLLKVPHHGSCHNLNTYIIDQLRPQKSYISAIGNSNHPNGRLVYWLSKYGPVYSTHTANSYIHYKSKDMPERKGSIALLPLKKKMI